MEKATNALFDTTQAPSSASTVEGTSAGTGALHLLAATRAVQALPQQQLKQVVDNIFGAASSEKGMIKK